MSWRTRIVRDYRRQIAVVQNLSMPPRPGAEIKKFSVEEWAGGTVCVIREYCPGPHAASLIYTDCTRVGPRGATKVIYDHIIY